MKLKSSRLLAVSLCVGVAILSSCVDNEKNLFDAEQTKELYQNAFPVKDIDPDMDWKTTRNAQVSIGVNEDWGTDYKIQIFDANPLNKSGHAKLLAEGSANQETRFETTLDCPMALNSVYVLRTDTQNRHLLKYVSIDNNRIEATFGIQSAVAKASPASANGIETYTPEKSESEVIALAVNAPELTSSTVIKAGEIFKIRKGETFNHRIYTDGIWSGAKATVIIEGTWNPQENLQQIETGIDVYVTSSGKIIVPKDKELRPNGRSRLIVFAGGIIEGEDNSKIYFPTASNGEYNYNAGTIEVDEIHTDGSNGVFYNCGTMKMNKLNFQNIGARFINQGKLEIEKTSEHVTIENGCYLKVEAFNGHLKLGISCAALIEEYNPEKHWGRTLTMGKSSMLTITGNTELSGATFTGPSDAYSLIKIEEIESLESFKSSGNIYYEIKEIDENISTESWMSPFFDALKNSEGVIAKYGESPLIIPAGECTGEGNTPNTDGEDIETKPISYTYAFEDNYPLAGDYDFNDIVMNVSTEYDREESTNKIRKIRYNITLNAVGASKKLGAGLRLAGISKNAVEHVTFSGHTAMRETLVNSMFDNNNTENAGSEIVIPLFGDAHQVYGYGNDRKMLNTGQNKTNELYTLEVIITLTDKNQTEPLITKDNLDFFIAYTLGNQNKRTEIHLYEFRDYGATANGDIHQQNLDVAGQFTWAISVPDFKYPIEGIKITEAYPLFEKWAQNHTGNLEWYEYPTDKTDKKYIYE